MIMQHNELHFNMFQRSLSRSLISSSPSFQTRAHRWRGAVRLPRLPGGNTVRCRCQRSQDVMESVDLHTAWLVSGSSLDGVVKKANMVYFRQWMVYGPAV